MQAWRVVALVALVSSPATAASTPRQDELVGGYFEIWDQDANVTFDNVAKLYAPTLIYYGRRMTRESLLRDKLEFIRRWPERRYAVVPGSASKSCDSGETHCRIMATLAWRTGGVGGTRRGRSRVSLVLAHTDGGLKIVREGAVTLAR